MGHPYRGAARGTTKGKFSSILGSPKGAKHMDNDSVVNPHTPVKKGIEDVKIMGNPGQKRLDRARGGKVKGNTTVNVIVAPKPDAPMATPPMPPMPAMPPMPPKPPMGGMPPPGAGPVMPGPGAGLPLNKARGGYIGGQATGNKLKQWATYSRKNSYHKKDGGGVDKYPITGGAESGVGRAQLSKAQHKKK